MVSAYAWLATAIALEVGATLSLRVAARGRWRWYLPVIAGYVAAFASLAVALDAGLELGVAYGIWAASGVVLTAVLAHLLFAEPLSWLMGGGVALVVVGVLLVELGAH